jgi:hypothetical protein
MSKYWLKFSSPLSTVPHGVTPPAQLLRVPSTVRPTGSAVVRSRRSPAAGPSSRKGVEAVIRRFRSALRTGTAVHRPVPDDRRRSSTTDMPWLAISIRIIVAGS